MSESMNAHERMMAGLPIDRWERSILWDQLCRWEDSVNMRWYFGLWSFGEHSVWWHRIMRVLRPFWHYQQWGKWEIEREHFILEKQRINVEFDALMRAPKATP